MSNFCQVTPWHVSPHFDFNFLLSNHPTSLYKLVWQCHSSCQFCAQELKPGQDKNLYTSSLWPTPQNLLVKIFLILYICYHLHCILFILFPTIWLACKCSQPWHTVCKITTLHPPFLEYNAWKTIFPLKSTASLCTAKCSIKL